MQLLIVDLTPNEVILAPDCARCILDKTKETCVDCRLAILAQEIDINKDAPVQ